MATIEDIIDAVRGLTFEQYLDLRQRLDALEEDEWQAELTHSTAEWKAAGLTDDDIDRAIARRRYEGRS